MRCRSLYTSAGLIFGVLLVLATHQEADAISDLQRSVSVSDLGAGQGDAPENIESEANAEVARQKLKEQQKVQDAEEAGVRPEDLKALEAQKAQKLKNDADTAMAKEQMKSEELPSTKDILSAVKQNSNPEAEKEEEAGEIVPGDLEEIKAQVKKKAEETDLDTMMSKKEQKRFEAFVQRASQKIVVQEVGGVPKHIVQAIIDDPDSAKKLFSPQGEIPEEADAPTKEETEAEAEEEEEEEHTSVCAPGTPCDPNALKIRKGESLEQYFMRVLEHKGRLAGLAFNSARQARDWFVSTAGNLVRAEKGMGWESSIRKAAVLVAKAQADQIHARMEITKARLVTARDKLAKEISRKAGAATVAKQYNAVQRAADRKKEKARLDKEKLKAVSKKASKLELKARELKGELKGAKSKMNGALAKAGNADKQQAEVQKKAAKAAKTKELATQKLKRAKLEMLDANSEEDTDAAAAEVQAAESMAASATKQEEDAEKAEDEENSKQIAMKSQVVLDESKEGAIQKEEKEDEAGAAKAKEMKKMYKTQVNNAAALGAKDGKKIEEMEKLFVEKVLDAVRQPKVIKIKSATYVCPDQVDPKTKKEIPNEDLLAQMAGNQNDNLARGCNGYTNCEYMVDPTVIGEAAPDCASYAYSVKYTCVSGTPKKSVAKESGSDAAKESESAEIDHIELVQLLAPFDDKEVTNAEEQEAEDEQGETKAQKETEELNADLGNLKATLKESDESKKTSKIDGESTEEALKDTEAELKNANGSSEPKTPMQKKKAEDEKVLTGGIAGGEGRKSFKLQCIQKQDPEIQKAEGKVKVAKLALAAAEGTLQKDADNNEEKVEEKVAEGKAKVAEDDEKMKTENHQILKDKQRVEELETKVKELNQELKTSTSEEDKSRISDALEEKSTELQDLKAKMDELKTKREETAADSKVASDKMAKVKAQVQFSPHTEMHTRTSIEEAEKAVEIGRGRVREFKDMIEKVTEMLTQSVEPAEMSARESQLLKLTKELHHFEDVYETAKHTRDEMALDVPEKAVVEHKAQVLEDEKKQVKDSTKVKALKMEMSKSQDDAEANDLQAQLDEAEHDEAKDEKRSLDDEYMPALKETTVVTKLEKEGLVEEAEKDEEAMEEEIERKEDEVETATDALQDAEDPAQIYQLVNEMTRLKKELMAMQGEEQHDAQKVADAKNIDAKSGDVLVQKMEGSVEDAKASLEEMEAEIPHLQEEMDDSSDPVQVKSLAAKLDLLKKKIDVQKQRIVRRETRESQVEKVVATEGPTPEKPPSKMARLEAADPALQNEAENVDVLRAKLKEANTEFASTINKLLRHKESTMKAAVNNAKRKLADDDDDLQKTKVRYMEAKKIMDYEGKAAQAFSGVTSALVDGKYEAANNIEAAHKDAQDSNFGKREPEEVAQTLMALSVPSKDFGVCKNADCCLKSYRDITCRVDFEQMCQKSPSTTGTGDWRDLTPISAVFNSSTSAGIVTVNRTMHVRAMWARQEQQNFNLEIQVCGKFTKDGADGATVCFPQDLAGEPIGLPVGQVIGAKAGECVRTVDFMDVARTKLLREVNKGVVKARKAENAKLTKPKEKQIDSITEAVSRAIGGAFKGEFGGVSKEDEMLSSVVEFIEESSGTAWEAMFNEQGSFMVTNEPIHAGPPGSKREPNKPNP